MLYRKLRNLYAVRWLVAVWMTYIRPSRRFRKDGTRTFYRPGMFAPKGYAFNPRGDLVNLRRERMRRGEG